MDLYDVMRTTFAAREFTGEPLPDRTLYRILDNARFAPSGGNRQAVRIIVVRDKQTRDRLAELSVPGAQRYVAQLGICPGSGEPEWWRPPTRHEVPDTFTHRCAGPRCPRGVSDLRYVAATDQDLSRVRVVWRPVYPLV